MRSFAALLVILVGSSSPVLANCYSVTNLGALAANGLNRRAHVVGYLINAEGNQHAFLWQDGVTEDLGTLGGFRSYAQSLNTWNQVVGWSYPGGPTGDHAFLWDDGSMIDLGTFGGNYSSAWSINDWGVVVGAAENASGTSRAFLWWLGAKIDLGTLGGSDAEARAINDRWQVAGFSRIAGDVWNHAFLWQSGTMIDLGTLGGHSSMAFALNLRGQVVGIAETSTEAHAFLWERGVMTDLGTLGGEDSVARGINVRGQIVGRADTIVPGLGDPRGFIWERGVMTDLSSLVPASEGWTILDANAIDDRGQIVGMGRRAGVGSGVLLTPTAASNCH